MERKLEKLREQFRELLGSFSVEEIMNNNYLMEIIGRISTLLSVDYKGSLNANF